MRMTPQQMRELLTPGCTADSDLLDVLEADDVDRPWVEQVAATAHQLAASGSRLQLIACERNPRPDGECAVVFVDRSRLAAVRVGDEVSAGVAVVRSPEHGLCVMPRVFRMICSNGAIVERDSRWQTPCEWHEVGDAMRDCLDQDLFTRSVASFRRATTVRVADVAALAHAAGAVTDGMHLTGRAAATDPSLFGVINAATERAHLDTRWSQRLDRERDAARLLAAAELSAGPRPTRSHLSIVGS